MLAAAATGVGAAAAGGGGAGVAAGVATWAGPAAPIIRVKSLCTGWAGITGAAGGRLIFAPGIGVAETEGDDGSGTTGGGPDQGLDGDNGGGGGGAAGRGGGATTRSRADVALGVAPLTGAIGGGMNWGWGAGGESGSRWVAPNILVNSPGAAGFGAAGFGAAGGGAGALGGGGGGAAAGLGALEGSLNRTEMAGGWGLGSDLGSGGGALGTDGGVHDTVGESISATGVPRGWTGVLTKMSVNPPPGAPGAVGAAGGDTRSSHLPNESKSRIMRVTTTGAPSTLSTANTRSRASGETRSRRASMAERSDALS